MKRVFLPAPAAAVAAFAASVAVAAEATIAWQPDLVHSRAEFTVSHMVVSKVWGHIPIRAMTIVTRRASVVPERIDALLDVAHEDTDNHARDEDLRSQTYFDTGRYPTMAFHSTSVTPGGTKDFTVTGALTIKNVTKTVTFPVHVEGIVPNGDGPGRRVGYSGTLHIDRRDFGITDTRLAAVGVLLVGYDVSIGLTAEAVTDDASVAALK